MTTIAADILRDYQAEMIHLNDTEAGGEQLPSALYLLMIRLCEEARGTRIGYHEWVFPDGSQLVV